MLSVFPIEIFASLQPGVTLLSILQINRMCRLFRIRDYFDKLLKFIDEKEIQINQGIVRLFALLASIIFVEHFVTCIWYLIGATGNPSEETWIIANSFQNLSMPDHYFKSLYWTTTTMNTASSEITDDAE